MGCFVLISSSFSVLIISNPPRTPKTPSYLPPVGCVSSRCPVLFFQGLDDKVVPPEQTERMAAALTANGIAVDIRLFKDEGHGFRNQSTQIQVLEETEAFFRRQLGMAEQRI